MNNKVKRLLIIPARGNSKRIHNKNIKLFYSRPIIYYILDNAKKSKLFTKIHVSTDSKKIAKVVKKKLSIDFYRPKILSTSKTPVIKVIQFVLKEYEKLRINFDEIWCILPCSPLINVVDLKNISKKLLKIKKPLITISRFPCPVEWALDMKGSKLIPMNRKKLLINSQYFSHKYYDTGQIFAAPVGQFKKIKDGNIITASHGYLMPPQKSVDIDDMIDWKFAETLYRGIKFTNYE
jgi:N-acylneuraminate cytidylyltransferase